MAADLGAIPVALLAVLGVVAFGQVALDVVALVDLYRRPAAQVVFGNKWIWVALILLVNLIGAILYLAIGRQPAPAPESTGAVERPAAEIQDVVDSLYGKERSQSGS